MLSLWADIFYLAVMLTSDTHIIKWFRLWQWLWVAVVAALAIGLLGWADGGAATAALTLAYHMPRLMYARSRVSTPAGQVILTAAAAWLALLAIIFLWQSSVGEHTLQWPYLEGDMSKHFRWAVHHYSGQVPKPKITSGGYSASIVALWWIFGQSLIWPVALNVMLTLFSLVITGQMAVSALSGSVSAPDRRISTWAIGLSAVSGFYLSQGAMLLKEPWVYIAITLVGWGLAEAICQRRGMFRPALLFLAGGVILSVIRAKYVNFLPIGIALLLAADWRRHWRLASVLAMLSLGLWMLGLAISDHYTVEQQVNNVTGNALMHRAFDAEGWRGAFVAAYYGWPWWARVLVLPLTVVIQTVIPLPWPPMEQLSSVTAWLPRIQWGWYVVAGLAVWFYVRYWLRAGRGLRLWCLFAPACLAAIAYMTAGLVSRYALPFEPLVAVTAVAALFRRRGQEMR